MKTTMLKNPLNLLSKTEKEVLLSLKPFFELKGLLSGGTSLMLQIPKRRSYDFDLFFQYEIPSSFLRKASKIFTSNIEVLINTPDELTFTALNKVKVSLIFFPFKRKYKPIFINKSIALSLYKDIASDKAYVIGRKPEYRDYVDLFTILKSNLSLNQIILDAKEKFGGEFSEKLFLSQLIYFGDLKDFTIEFIKEEHDSNEIKNFFGQIVSQRNL